MLAEAAAGPDRGATAAQIVRAVEDARRRAYDARTHRRALNRRNWDFYHGRQDWSHKVEGQSRESLPDLPIQIEQIAAALERQLTSFSDWFLIESLPAGEPVLDPEIAQQLLAHLLQRLAAPGDGPDAACPIQAVLAGGLKLGLIESEIVLKVYGVDCERPVYQLAPGPEGIAEGYDTPTYERASRIISRQVIQTFRLAVDLIPYEDFYPDPGPFRLYDIHEVTRHVTELRTHPDYDPEAVLRIATKSTKSAEDWDKRRREGQELPTEDPHQIRLMEFWGDLIDPQTGDYVLGEDGEPYKNQLCTVCCGEVLRWPTPNPRWDGYRPFIRTPLVPTPKSSVHKAFMDHAVPMAQAENEIFSLMLDGAISAVWGIRQVHEDLLMDPDEIAKGIPPAATLRLRRGVPAGQKVVERVDDYTAPMYADLMLKRAGDARQMAMRSNDLAVGQLPPRQVKATELVQADEARTTLLDAVAARLDPLIQSLLELAWSTVWQGMDDFTAPELLAILGPQRTAVLQAMPAAMRFMMFVNGVTFKVNGLQRLKERQQDFQKHMTVLNLIASNPAFAQAYDLKFSILKQFAEIFKCINLDPATIEKDVGAPAELNPALLSQPGQQASTPPAVSSIEQGFAPANPEGSRGPQM